MKIKFKLLKKQLVSQGLELQVSECFYNNQIINRITFKHNHKISANAENNQLFIIKNIKKNEIKFDQNIGELIIDSLDLIISLPKLTFFLRLTKLKKLTIIEK